MKHCSRCGTELFSDMLAGACPKCVAQTLLGMSSHDVVPGQAGSKARIRYLGDYELEEEIGRGGMGIVFRARQVSLNRPVALKLLLHGTFATEEGVRRFHAEAEAAASLKHPNIVSIHEVGTHDGYHYFSMDFVEGRNLAQLMEGKPLPSKDAARYVQVVAEAIQHAHDRGIVHRDLKPSNILVDALDRPHVTDFGLSKRLEDKSELTLPGQVLGAPSFMSPEQAAAGGRQVGVASDIYALGAVLYSLLSGRPPFQGATVVDTLAQVQQTEPVSIRKLNPEVSPELEAVCLRCLEKAPGNRYVSAADLAADLGRWLAGKPVLARPPNLTERVWRWGRRHPALASAAILLLLGGGSAAGLWPRPEPLVIPPDVSELILVIDNTDLPMTACITDPRGRFWHRLPVPTGQLDISPDGRHLCFVRREGPTNSSIWLCQLDGSGKKRLAREGGVPVWLDERTVLYQTGDLLSVRTVDIHTLQDKEAFRWDAITTRGCAGSVQLTPDRKRLLVNPQNLVLKRGTGEYVHYSPTMDLYTCDQNGKNVQLIWEDAGDSEDRKRATMDCHPVWLGTNRVVWCRHAIADNRVQDMAIVTCRLGETNFTALTGWRGYSYPLSGSPDGQRILYVTEDAPGGGNLELWTMKADGTDRQKVLNRKFGCDLQINARWVKRPQ